MEPTLTRILQKFYPNKREWKNIIRRHLDAFKLNIRGRCNIDLITSSEDELWVLGQHHGLYTPLLDWSKSPYVALFFALQGDCSCKKKERTLWAINMEDIDTLNEQYLKKKRVKKRSVSIINSMSHQNSRLVSQGGLCLKVSVGTDIETWVRKGMDTGWVTLYKINFPDSIRNDAIGALDNMNINQNSLFPDLSGASSHCNYLLEIEPYLESKRNELWNTIKK